MKTDLGYDPQRAMSLPIPVHDNTHISWQDRSQYFEQLRAKIAAMPQIEVAGISTNATPPWNGDDRKIEIMGRSTTEKPEVRLNFISPEYFPLLRIPLEQGRIWDHAETMRGAPVVVVNQAMARQYWPSGNPVGQQLRVVDLKAEPPYSQTALGSDGWLQIVGIVGDARDDGLRKPVKPAIYVPYTLQLWMFTQILVRTKIPPLSVLREIRAQVLQVDPEQ